MKKLFLTAAFTLVGVIAVSAQTQTTQKPAESTTNNQTTTTQTQPQTSETKAD